MSQIKYSKDTILLITHLLNMMGTENGKFLVYQKVTGKRLIFQLEGFPRA